MVSLTIFFLGGPSGAGVARRALLEVEKGEATRAGSLEDEATLCLAADAARRVLSERSMVVDDVG